MFCTAVSFGECYHRAFHLRRRCSVGFMRGVIRGFDAGKKVRGRKRHIIADTKGLLVHAVIHGADMQDRYRVRQVLEDIRSSFLWLHQVFADGGNAGSKLRQSLAKVGTKWNIAIIKWSDRATGFAILPRPSAVECTFAWLNGNRRLSSDFEQSIETVCNWLSMASGQLLAGDIAKLCYQTQ